MPTSFNGSYIPAIPDPMYLTLDQVRAGSTVYMNSLGTEGIDLSVQGPYSDAQILSLISQASRSIDGYLKGSIYQHLVQEDQMGNGTNFLQLRQRPLWGGLSTTLTAQANPGDTSLTVANIWGFLPGQFVVYPTNPDYPVIQPIANPFLLVGPAVASSFVSGTGPGTIPLAYALTKTHLVGESIAVSGLDFVAILLPYSVYPLPISVLTQRYAQGQLLIWTPLEIQLFGVSTVFPKNIPLRVQYTSGFTPDMIPGTVQEACRSMMLYIIGLQRYEGVTRFRSGARALEFAPPVVAVPL